MPMTDYIDARCPFCRNYLTDLDGVYECQDNGCGAYEVMTKQTRRNGLKVEYTTSFRWETAENPFVCNTEVMADFEIYNSKGELVGGEKFDMALFKTGRWE